MRKRITKIERQKVYEKYDGHCGYCGCELKYQDMQVDHIEPVFSAEYYGLKPNNSIENYMPSCRACNFYKGTKTIEEFRRDIEKTLIGKLRKDFNYKMLIKYGMIHEDFKCVRFYFEKGAANASSN